LTAFGAHAAGFATARRCLRFLVVFFGLYFFWIALSCHCSGYQYSTGTWKALIWNESPSKIAPTYTCLQFRIQVCLLLLFSLRTQQLPPVPWRAEWSVKWSIFYWTVVKVCLFAHLRAAFNWIGSLKVVVSHCTLWVKKNNPL